MQSLEARVAYLEGLLQQVRPEVALDHLGIDGEITSDKDATSGGASVSTDYHSPILPAFTEARACHDMHSSATTAVAAASSDASLDHQVDVLSSEVALLCLSAAGREPHYFGPSSAVSFSRIASVTMGLGPASGSSVRSATGDSHTTNARIPLDLLDTFPAPASAVRLAQAYWQNIHPQYPFLHRPTFEVWERQCSMAYAERDMQHVHGLPLFFVLMVRYMFVVCLSIGI